MLALAILIGGHHIGWSLAVLPAWVLLISVYLIFLRIEFPRIGQKIQERDVVGNGEIAGAMVGSAVENQKDVLPGKLAREDIKKRLEACRIRSRHDQIDESAVLRCDRALQIDVFTDQLGGHLGPCSDRRPARPWPILC
jgi:hypothetical protein